MRKNFVFWRSPEPSNQRWGHQPCWVSNYPTVGGVGSNCRSVYRHLSPLRTVPDNDGARPYRRSRPRTQHRNEATQFNKRKHMDGRKGWKGKVESRFSKNLHIGGGWYRGIGWHCTAEGGGVEQAVQRAKKQRAEGNRSSLRLRRQVLPAGRPGAMLLCLPSRSCFLQP